MLRKAKDKITSALVQKFLNTRFQRYGSVTALRIDSRLRRGEVQCELLGEVQPVLLVVEQYSLRRDQEKAFVRIEALSCNRVWLENVVKDVALDRWFEVPRWAALAL